MVRRENMAATLGIGQSLRKVMYPWLYFKFHSVKSNRYRGVGAKVIFGSEGSLVLQSQMLAGDSESPIGRGVGPCDWWIWHYKYTDSENKNENKKRDVI